MFCNKIYLRNLSNGCSGTLFTMLQRISLFKKLAFLYNVNQCSAYEHIALTYVEIVSVLYAGSL